MRTTNRFLPLALLVFLTAGIAAAQTTPMEITLGYRFVNVDGNNEEYRSQINEREGFILRNVTFATADCCANRGTRRSPPLRRLRSRRGPRGSAAPGNGPRGTLQPSLLLPPRRCLQRAARLRQSPVSGGDSRPAHLQPGPQSVRRRAQPLPGQDRHADHRLHPQHLLGTRPDDLLPSARTSSG